NGAERLQIVEEWNQTAREFPGPVGVHEMVQAQAQRIPDRIAAACNGMQLSYRQLNRCANRLAHHLKGLQVGPESLVGLCMSRSLELAISLLGSLKAGAAYLPLDPGYPAQRLAYILTDAGVSVLLTEKSLLPSLPGTQALKLCPDEWMGPTGSRDDRNPSATGGFGEESLSYVIYTSGSTGQPKGVQLTQRSLRNLLQTIARIPGLAQDDILLAVTTLSFDIASLEFLLPWTLGARNVLASRGTARDAARLRQALDESGATVMQATPTSWRLLMELESQSERPLKIKAFCAGEALTPELASGLISRGASLWNLYGPSETTIYSTRHPVSSGTGPVPIGEPVDNTRTLVLDRHLHPVPVGVPGELLIGGLGLARGYLRRPALTAERFIPDAFSPLPGERLYRSGDLTRHRPDGKIEYLGRIDTQVKLRGFRIELGEIESALAEHPSVRQAAVVLQQDPRGDGLLVAYVAGRRQEAGGRRQKEGSPRSKVQSPKSPLALEPAAYSLQPTALSPYLRERLPEFMIPAQFISVDEMPLTPSGKVDRKALPTVQGHRLRPEVSCRKPQSEPEQLLAGIWKELLELDEVSVHDNFFDLGGHSFLIVRIQNRLEEALDLRIPVAKFFAHPTINALAAYLSRIGGKGEGVSSQPTPAPAVRARIERQKKARLKRRRRPPSFARP
ncbi:MAG: non-ribosomal peptide synthetase, partial [Acidobacteriota bacterium]